MLDQATTALLALYSTGNTNNDCCVLPFGIDLNLGCPQECDALHGGYGAFLVENDIHVAISCVSSMRDAIDNY